MRKFLILALIALMPLLLLAACGGDDDDAAAAAAAASAQQAAAQAAAAEAERAAAQAATDEEEAQAAAAEEDEPAQAAVSAGGAPVVTSTGYDFRLQYACINRTFDACELVAEFLVPRIAEVTNGQVELQVTSFPELGIGGPDTLRLVEDGTLAMGEIYAGYVGGDLPIVDAQYLWGTVRDRDKKREAVIAARPILDAAVSAATGDGIVLLRNWYPSDNYVFAKEPWRTLDDWVGKKTRQHSTVLGDFLAGFNADGQFVAFADVYTALERGVLDAAVTCAGCAVGVKWFEVTDYLIGPIPDRSHTWGVVNRRVWEEFPADIQDAITFAAEEYNVLIDSLVEEWEALALEELIAGGMEVINFSPEVQQAAWDVALNRIVPNWVSRTGGPDSDAVAMWNEHFAPRLGIEILADGSAIEVPITR